MCNGNGIVQFFDGTQNIKDSTLDRTALPASKAFNESRLRRPRCLMSLAFPGAASMAGAWFIHWPVWLMRGVYRLL